MVRVGDYEDDRQAAWPGGGGLVRMLDEGMERG